MCCQCAVAAAYLSVGGCGAAVLGKHWMRHYNPWRRHIAATTPTHLSAPPPLDPLRSAHAVVDSANSAAAPQSRILQAPGRNCGQIAPRHAAHSHSLGLLLLLLPPHQPRPVSVKSLLRVTLLPVKLVHVPDGLLTIRGSSWRPLSSRRREAGILWETRRPLRLPPLHHPSRDPDTTLARPRVR